ncbi:MAG: flavodoxin [Gammaproteobacteria bacterium]|jgi:NAD(P)H-dependent FMN reductase|nr:flavodoxin [Gammaproteobacteria bacterium]MBT4492811.1 flavodoxin [Gammaproteobacteria bacterium]
MAKHLLIIYHSKTGKNGRMAESVNKGACHPDVDIEVRLLRAAEAGVEDLLWADGILFGTPENFGYMSGALKDFFDRTFYEVEGQVDGKPYSMFVGAGNDGRGALAAIRKICIGYNFREVQDPVLIAGDLKDSDLDRCEELGLAMAAGIDAGVF